MHPAACAATIAWIFLVPIFATAFGLVYAVLVDRTRFEAAAKALIFLPTAISHGGGVGHLEVRLLLAGRPGQRADRPAERDRHGLRRQCRRNWTLINSRQAPSR